MPDKKVSLDYYSDILCVWAYVAQVRLDEIKSQFGDSVEISYRFFSLFGDTQTRLGVGWAEKGGFSAFYDHVRQVCDVHPHLKLHSNVWSESCRPNSSALPHLVLQAVDLLHQEGAIDQSVDTMGQSIFEQYIKLVRSAFFEQGKNIGNKSVMFDIAEQLGIDCLLIQQKLDDGTALALHSLTNEERYTKKLEGSPTFILDGGRQKLYGNVGYKVIEANIQELTKGVKNEISWC